jgi:hypothetical protein
MALLTDAGARPRGRSTAVEPASIGPTLQRIRSSLHAPAPLAAYKKAPSGEGVFSWRERSISTSQPVGGDSCDNVVTLAHSVTQAPRTLARCTPPSGLTENAGPFSEPPQVGPKGEAHGRAEYTVADSEQEIHT